MEPLIIVIGLGLLGILLGIFGAIIGSTLLILVPLFNFIGLPMHVALGSAKTSQLGRELVPIFVFNKNKLIDFKLAIPFIITGAIFSIIGTYIVFNLSEKTLSTIVGIFMVVISLIIFFKPNLGMHEKKIKKSKKTLIYSLVLGSLVGLYVGVFGGGVNVLIITTFVAVFGNNFLKAVANSKFPNFIFGLISSIFFIAKGYINWYYTLPILITTPIGAYFGAKLAIQKGNKFIRAIFVGLVIVMAIKLIFFN